MKQFLKDLISGNANTSSIRVCMFICVFTACIVAILSVILDKDLIGTATLVGALLTTVFAKAVQTFGEK